MIEETKPTKAWVGGVGATVTALSAAWVAVEATLADGFTLPDITSIATTVISLGLTVWGIWRVPNNPKVTTR